MMTMPRPFTPSAAEDRSAESFWLKEAKAALRTRDPLDAANDVEVLAAGPTGHHMPDRPAGLICAVATFCKPQQPHFRKIKMGKAARLFFDIVSPALSHRTGRSTQRSASPASSSPGTMGGGTGRAGVTMKSARYSLSAAICASSSSIRRRISRLSLSVSGLATGRVSGSVSGPTSGPASGTQTGGPGGICGGFFVNGSKLFQILLQPSLPHLRNAQPGKANMAQHSTTNHRTTPTAHHPQVPGGAAAAASIITNLPFFSSKVICRNSAAPTTGAPVPVKPVPVKTVPSETLPC